MRRDVRIAPAAGLLVLLLTLAAGSTHAQDGLRVFVKMRPDVRTAADASGLRFLSAEIQDVLTRYGVASPEPLLDSRGGSFAKRAGEEHPLDDLYLLTPARAGDIGRLTSELAALPGVLFAERESMLKLDLVPDDSAYASQWGMKRIGMEKAWDLTRGDASVVVGVIDTGIDPEHPDLRTQHWINAGEDRNGNGRFDAWPSTESRDGVAGDLDGVDNDGNGFADDVIGYDFVDQPQISNSAGGDYFEPDPLPFDEMGHGTNVSGIIAAATDNGVGVAGVAPDCRLMTLRAFDARGVGAEGDVARALAYAVANGVRLVNMSFGDVVYSRVLRDVIRWAYARGVVMVASAGNSHSTALHYPSAYDETISVSAISSNDVITGFSNYGQTIDITAPGADVLTTDPDGGYSPFFGTSASAPFVTGAAALVLSRHPQLNPEEVRGILIASAEDLGAQGWDERYGAGLLRVDRAAALDNPSVVRITSPKTDFATDGTEIRIRGTAASPLMRGYALSFGVGVNPSRWTPLTTGVLGQVIDGELAVWNIQGLADTAYTLRLVAESEKGITLEDRVVLHIDRTPPRFGGAVLVPSVEGAHYGLAAGFTTDDVTIGKVWYRERGSSAPFQWVSAEGETDNNLFGGRSHRIYLGPKYFTPGRTYEFYISAENAVGLESIARDENDRNFVWTAPPPISLFGFERKSVSLPLGRLSRLVTDLDRDGVPELLMNNIRDDNAFEAWESDGLGFTRADGGAQGIEFPRGAGDLDGDGNPELLTSFVRNGFLYRGAAGAFPSQRLWADTTGGDFWAVDIADVDRDGVQEILAVIDDSTFGIFRYEGGSMVEEARLVNPTSPGSEPYNSFDAPRAACGDFNANGKPDILLGDRDADFFIVEYDGARWDVIWGSENDFIDGGNFVEAGDFDGDGRDEFAIGFRTLDDDVVPFWFFAIFRLKAGNTLEGVWSAQLHGVAESAQYGSFTRIENSLTAGNLDADPEPELVIAAYPELYVLDFDRAAGEFEFVWHLPLANTDAAAIADFDGNGIPEMAIATPDSVFFYERDLPYTGPEPPRSVDVAYADSRTARISWTIGAAAPQYRLYRGSAPGAMELMGSFAGPLQLSDPTLTPGSPVLYAVTAVDENRNPPESPKVFSRLLRPHDTPVVDSVAYVGEGQLRMAVSEDMGTAIPSPSHFLLNGSREPESVALLDTHTLLLSFGTLQDGTYGIALRGLRDGEGVPFDDLTAGPIDVRNAASEGCYIARVEYLPPRSFDVWFSGPMDPATTGVAANYEFQPAGSVERAEPDAADPSRVRLTVGDDARIGARGEEYVLKVRNLRCASGASIGEGAGSTAGVILNAANLDDVYVFPSPLKPEHGQDFITFANLTARAAIRIYTLSGLFIAEVVEDDGNGGVQWDLRDDTGGRVPAGIYVFHATGSDAAGREVEAKTGKFAIVR